LSNACQSKLLGGQIALSVSLREGVLQVDVTESQILQSKLLGGQIALSVSLREGVLQVDVTESQILTNTQSRLCSQSLVY
jgi:uncharacterized membrane protein